MSDIDINQVTRDGKAVIANCDFGFMVTMESLGNGRVRIECPVNGTPIYGKAEADHVRKAISGWSKRLAVYDLDNPDS